MASSSNRPRRCLANSGSAFAQQASAGRTPETQRSGPTQHESFQARLACVPLSPAARRLARLECEQLGRLPASSQEAGHIARWLDWMLALPWPKAREFTEHSSRKKRLAPGAERNFQRVADLLEQSHSGRSELKERITEYLAVRRLGGDTRGSVLCFVGPPGTGKSSMARAVAQALGKSFVEVPVGGLSLERELVGSPHRQDDGSPGLLMQAIARARRADAVVLIDEIDKLGPQASSALAQILDREHADGLYDRYLGVPFDLSRCLFLATASSTEALPEALLDRLEVLEFASYTEDEKLRIARRHLIPSARARAGLSASELKLDARALQALVRHYTNEAGVRELQRRLDALARKAAMEVVLGRPGRSIRTRDLFELLGPARADERLRRSRPAVGIATALAWTSSGGALLPVEAIAMPGCGRTILTGLLGDVLRESVQASISFVRTRLARLGLASDTFEHLDLHLHFPAGATPKDGPSAGIAIVLALVSLLSGVPLRHRLALTGEVSLHGDVLPVGGVRDKLLAAVHAGYKEVIVPARNAQDVMRLSNDIKRALQIHRIERVDEAFEIALSRPLQVRGRRRATRRRSA